MTNQNILQKNLMNFQEQSSQAQPCVVVRPSTCCEFDSRPCTVWSELIWV